MIDFSLMTKMGLTNGRNVNVHKDENVHTQKKKGKTDKQNIPF